MPVRYEHPAHQAGLDGLAVLLGQNVGGDFVENTGGRPYCLVTIQLATQNALHRQLRLLPPPASPGPSVGSPDVFEDRLDAALTLQNGAIRVHRRVYVVPCEGADGEPTARALWALISAAGTTQQQPQARPHSWLAGDAVYIHFPADNGIGFVGAVVSAEGALLPAWP